MASSAEHLGFDGPEKGGEDEATVAVMEPPGTVLYPESDLIGPLGPARVMLPASWVLPLLGWELMVIKGGTTRVYGAIRRQKTSAQARTRRMKEPMTSAGRTRATRMGRWTTGPSRVLTMMRTTMAALAIATSATSPMMK